MEKYRVLDLKGNLIKEIIIPKKEKEKIKPIKKGWYVRIPHSPKLTQEVMKGLGSAERLSLLGLLSYEGKEGVICPSLRTLARLTGLSLAWQWRIIKKLSRKRKIIIIKEKGKYNTYKMLF